VHITDISWKKILKPQDVLKPQDEIKAKVMRIEDKDDKKRVFLSIKHLSADPWEEIKIKEGDVVEGKISNIVDYGIFIELSDGVEGLIHNSEISWIKFPKEAKEELSVGQSIRSKVLMVDTLKKKIALSIKRLDAEPWSSVEEKFRVGDIVEGVVTGIKDFGVFVKIEKGVESLVPRSELNNISVNKDEKVKIKIIRLEIQKRKMISRLM